LETWDAVRSRRNVREFSDRPLAADDLDRILEAGRRAPSAKNTQPWDFVVVTDRGRLRDLTGVWQGAWHVAGSQATVAFIVPDTLEGRWIDLAQFDLGHAVMSMMLTAADLGIGSCHASVSDQALARTLLGFPEGYFCAYLMSLGCPADRPLGVIENPSRRPLDEIVHRETW
jgi:nitroreductase